jgi:hypothetical protein
MKTKSGVGWGVEVGVQALLEAADDNPFGKVKPVI